MNNFLFMYSEEYVGLCWVIELQEQLIHVIIIIVTATNAEPQLPIQPSSMTVYPRWPATIFLSPAFSDLSSIEV
jgi:hypothetical protein